MTRRWPIVVLGLFCLLAFSATTSAECASVLWQEAPSGSGRWSLDTGMQVAFQTRGDCEQQLNARAQMFIRMNSRPDPTPFLACLPDTVDPRGPKAGGR